MFIANDTANGHGEVHIMWPIEVKMYLEGRPSYLYHSGTNYLAVWMVPGTYQE